MALVPVIYLVVVAGFLLYYLAGADITLEGFVNPRFILRHPTFWYEGNNDETMTVPDIQMFTAKTNLYSRAINTFSLIAEPKRNRNFKLNDEIVAA
jgi:hypothetical protein